MSIADKLTAIAENVQRVYDAGKAAGGGGDVVENNPLYYATELDNTFISAVFPDDYSLTMKFQKPPLMRSTFRGNIKGVTLISDDTTTETNFSQTFRDCLNLEKVDLTKFSRNLNADISYLCFGSSALKSILGALDLSNVTNANYAFFCASLVDVEIVPNTISCDIRFNSAYLSDASIQSIIDGLADLTGGTAKTLTLNGVGASLTDEQKATISAKNWTLAY